MIIWWAVGSSKKTRERREVKKNAKKKKGYCTVDGRYRSRELRDNSLLLHRWNIYEEINTCLLVQIWDRLKATSDTWYTNNRLRLVAQKSKGYGWHGHTKRWIIIDFVETTFYVDVVLQRLVEN